MVIQPAEAYEGEMCVVCYCCGCNWSAATLRASYEAATQACIDAGIAPNRLANRGKWGSFRHKHPHLMRSDFSDIRFLSLAHRIEGEEYSERALAYVSMQPAWRSFELSWLPSLIGKPAEVFHELFKTLAVVSGMQYGYQCWYRMVVPPKFYVPPRDSLESELSTLASYWMPHKPEQVDSLLLRSVRPHNYLSQRYLEAPVGVTGLSLREWIEDNPDERGQLRPFTDILTEWMPPRRSIPLIREILFRAGRLFYYRFFNERDPYYRPNIHEPWEATGPTPAIFQASRYQDLFGDRRST